MNIFAIAAATTIAATSIVAAPAVEASERCFTTRTDWAFCVRDNGDYGADQVVAVSPDASRKTSMNIVCTGNGGNRWEAFGHLDKAENQAIANWWCEKY